MTIAACEGRVAGTRFIPVVVLVIGACAEPQRPALDKSPHSQPAPKAEEKAQAAKPAARAARTPPPKKPRPASARKSTEPAPAPPPVEAKEPAADAPLDLTALVERLEQTKAIGLFTKVALKNQIDDLLEELRQVHEGESDKTLADLRAPYDRLFMKVLAALQDADPPLAKDIVASREEIWGFLADPSKFSTI